MVKQLNNTELGKAGTNDTYVLVPNKLDISDIFINVNEPVEFHDTETMEPVIARNTVRREKRIVGLGQYYRSKKLSAGDEIVFERRTGNGIAEYRVSVIRHYDMLVFQKSKSGIEILTPERLNMAKSWGSQSEDTIRIDFLEAKKKRNDSPDTTDYYDISVNGTSLMDFYSGKDTGFIYLEENKIKISSFYGWKKYILETEE
jgi:ASC-1-like (ASCH) protein